MDIPARVLAAMRAGASGYILKPFHAAELTRAVEDVLSGDAAPISPRAAKVLLSELRGDPPDQKAKDGPALSKRELEVLQLLVHGHTYADVAQALGIAEGTVQTYVKRIYEKMDVSHQGRGGAPRGGPRPREAVKRRVSSEAPPRSRDEEPERGLKRRSSCPSRRAAEGAPLARRALTSPDRPLNEALSASGSVVNARQH